MAGGERGSSVSLRRDLTDMAQEIDFSDLNLNASRVAPIVTVPLESGRYPVLPREAKMKVPNTRRQSDGSYTRGQWTWEDDNYYTREFGFEEPVDNVDALRDADYIDHEEQATKLAYEGLLLARESRVATALYNTTTWTGTSNTTAITNEWDDATNATPWANIDTAAKAVRGKCGYNKSQMSVIISDDLVEYAVRTNELKNYFQYSESSHMMLRSGIEEQAVMLKNYFGVKEVIIVNSIYDTTGLSSSATIGKFWSNEYIFVGKLNPTSGNNLQTQGVIKQIIWDKYSSDFIVEDYDEPRYNRKVIRAREYWGYKVNTDYGHLLTNAKTTVSSAGI